MRKKTRRLVTIGASFTALALAVGLMLYALGDTVTFFYSPSDLAERTVPADQRIRIGGLVEEGSVARGEGSAVSFVVTDLAHRVSVRYDGLLPDLFREGQGVVVQGRLADGVFTADEVLARHDETYMPPEVADALMRAGQWREGVPPASAGAATGYGSGY